MFRKEFAYYFSQPIAYIVLGIYWLGIGLFLWVLPGEWNILASGYAQVDGIFQLSPWFLMLLCSALTMRLVSEERRSGTWTLLRAQPISLTRIMVSKYLAAWVLTLIALLPHFIHFLLVSYIAEPMGNMDSGQFIGSLLGLALLSSTFTGVGLLAGSVTTSELMAFFIGAIANFILYWTLLQPYYRSISRGVVDTRDIAMMAGVAVVAVVGSIVLVDKVDKK